MKLLTVRLLRLLAVAVFSLAFAPAPTLAGTPTLSESEVIALANAEATKRKIDLIKFSPPNADYDAKANKWFVFYEGFAQKPGNHFSITVDDGTKAIRFWPGI